MSGGYGSPDIALVQRILEACYPDYVVKASVTGYIREGERSKEELERERRRTRKLRAARKEEE